jgi:hypothetical protein
MAEEKKQAAVQVKNRQPQTDKVAVPVEFSSVNRSINIIKDGDRVTISLHPAIVEEIGAYRRCNVSVVFAEDGPVRVLPQLDG